MDDTPPDWVLIEAAKRCDWAPGKTLAQLRGHIWNSGAYRVLCDMIYKYEQPPVDRKLLCAQAAVTGALIGLDASRFPKKECIWDCCVRAIELWEEGFGQ